MRWYDLFCYRSEAYRKRWSLAELIFPDDFVRVASIKAKDLDHLADLLFESNKIPPNHLRIYHQGEVDFASYRLRVGDVVRVGKRLWRWSWRPEGWIVISRNKIRSVGSS